MKKSTGKLTRKLTMNRETVRALASIELMRVAGGVDDTGDTNCVHPKIVNPPPAG